MVKKKVHFVAPEGYPGQSYTSCILFSIRNLKTTSNKRKVTCKSCRKGVTYKRKYPKGAKKWNLTY